MKIVIIKYNAGNIQSVKYALERIGVNPIITDDPEIIKSADKVIFPGVGEASSAMNYLTSKGLDKVIKSLTQPVLGICIGLQLMCEYSEEGDTTCLGIFPVKVRRFDSGIVINEELLKIPHMGWNKVDLGRSKLFKDISTLPYVYYVHSYRADLDSEYTIATSNYTTDYSAALQKDNFYAVQFHPEKSSNIGQQILTNFINL